MSVQYGPTGTWEYALFISVKIKTTIMPLISKFRCEGQECLLLSFRFATHREIDERGRPITPVRPTVIYCEFYFRDHAMLFSWLTRPDHGHIDQVDIILEDGSTSQQIRQMRLEDVWIIDYQESVTQGDEVPDSISVSFSAGHIEADGGEIDFHFL